MAGAGSPGHRARPALASAVAVIGVIVVALCQLHPSLLLANTTTAGGDTGAHVALPGLPREPPARPRPADRLGSELVRRLPALHLLLPAPRSDHRPLQRGDALQRRLQAGHGPRHAPAARLRLGVRAPGRVARPRTRVSRGSDPSLPVRAQLLDLRRQSALDARRRVLVLPLPLDRPAVPRGGGRRTAHRPLPRARRGPVRGHVAVPPDPGAVRRRRGGGLAPARRRPPPDVPLPGEGRPASLGAARGLGGGGRRDRGRAHRVVADPLRGRAALHDQHGLHQGLRLSRSALPRVLPVGAGRRPRRSGWPW